MHTILGRPWDSFDAYLFDIDGTLISSADAVHYFAFCEALTAVAGRPLNLDGVSAHGNVDVGILRDAFARAGVPESTWRPRLPEILESMGRFVENNQSDLRPNVLPAVPELLAHLRQRGATLGVATGNLARIGRLKLTHASLLSFFSVHGWSDSFESRTDVFRNAVGLMRAATSPSASICIVGDTPLDIQAAHNNDLPVLAVATGIYPLAQLQSESPELLLASFTDLFE